LSEIKLITRGAIREKHNALKARVETRAIIFWRLGFSFFYFLLLISSLFKDGTRHWDRL